MDQAGLRSERLRSAEARVGKWVAGKWQLARLIGAGGMAAVFEAQHKNGNQVAIKILHSDLAQDTASRDRFLSEGYIANRVSHAGVVSVRDEGTTDDGLVFLVMDMLRGETLAQRMQAGTDQFSVAEVLDIADQLLDVLVHAHDRGIIHRDIKPENVFLTREGRVKLLDFGIARVEPASGSQPTDASGAFGTPAFMPPEQALGLWEDLDGRTDLWAVGATLFLLLTGRPVRTATTVTEQILEAMTRPAPSLREVSALPRAVVAVVDRALAFDRLDRFPDARSMQLAMKAAIDELSTPDSRATLPPVSYGGAALEPPKTPSVSTFRPVASITTPLAVVQERPNGPGRGALPLFIAAGFLVGTGIVFAARRTVSTDPPSSAQQARSVRHVQAGSASAPLALSSASARASSSSGRPSTRVRGLQSNTEK
jgi:serine/threonine-protein kinase